MSPRALLAWFWTVVILALCWLPGIFLPRHEKLTGSFFVPNLDKLVHAGIFAIFAILWLRVIPGGRPGWKVFFAGLALAAISEAVQNTSLVNRDGNLADGLADMIGVVLGILAFAVVRKTFVKRAIQVEV